MLAAHLPTVRDVDTVDPDTTTGGGHQPSALLVDPGAEPVVDVVETDPAGDGHPVPAAVAVGRRFVAEGREGHGRKGGVGQLGLLHAQDIGSGVLDPFLHPRQTGVERVHVPGGDAHGLLESSGRPAVSCPRSSRVHDDEKEVDLAGQGPADGGPTVTGPGPRREPTEMDLEIEDLAGGHLAAKARPCRSPRTTGVGP